MSVEVNSEEYWDRRFSTNWREFSGPQQSIFFAKIAFENFPRWFLNRIAKEKFRLVDWGCAEGDALGFFCRYIPSVQLSGVDFSTAAIKLARSKYPHIQFDCENWIEPNDHASHADFDIVFSSNTLEHFHDPRVPLQILAAHARRYLVLALPYREDPAIDEHFFTFIPENIPSSIESRFSLVYARVINCSKFEPTYWAAEQILLIYASADELPFLSELSLADRCIEADDVTWLKEIENSAALLRGEVERLHVAASQTNRQAAQEKIDREAESIRHQADATQVNQENFNLRVQIATLETELDKARCEIESIRLQHDRVLGQISKENSSLHAALEDANALAAQAGQEVESTKVQYEELIDHLRIENSNLQFALSVFDSKFERVWQQVDSERQHHEAILSKLQQDNTTLQAALDEALFRTSEARDKFESVMLQHESVTSQLYQEKAVLASALDSANTRLAQVMKDHDFAILQYHEFAVKLRRENESLSLAVSMAEEKAADAVNKFFATQVQYEQQAANFQRELDGLVTQCVDDSRVLASLKKQVQTLTCSHLQRTISSRSADLSDVLLMLRTARISSLDSLVAIANEFDSISCLLGDLEWNQALLIFGMNDWNFRTQRPQHMAKEFARAGRTVIYVSPSFLDSPSTGYSLQKIDSRLYELKFSCFLPLSIHADAPDERVVKQIVGGLNNFLVAAVRNGFSAVVQHPFWYPIVGTASPSASLLVYDRFDNIRGFPGVADSLVMLEDRLVSNADLIICSSENILRSTREISKSPSFLVRNACAFSHFYSNGGVLNSGSAGKVVGYFGAIEEWFDVELIEYLARQIPEVTFRLIGQDQIDLTDRLRHFENVDIVGEVPYDDLPAYLMNFDVCIIPFLLNDLTNATDPVKVYEYLSSGKPVVSTALPELSICSEIIYIAGGYDEFVEMVRRAICESSSASIRSRRIDFARENSWAVRTKSFMDIIDVFLDGKKFC